MIATLTKEEELLNWCEKTKVFSRIDVIRWGLENQYIRADRTVRDFVTQEKVRRLSDDEAILKGYVRPGFAHVAWYEFLKK